MKKFFISSVVIIAFVAYSIYHRTTNAQSMPAISPKENSSQTTTSTPTPTPTSSPISQPTTKQPNPTNTLTLTPKPKSGYKDGTYTGDSADAFYGMIQVQATIVGGQITNIKFLQYPNERSTSIDINQQADPILAQEAIQTQNANVNIISGATNSSNAFIQSLQSALDKAKT